MDFKELVKDCNDEIKTYKEYNGGNLIENLKNASVIINVYDSQNDQTIVVEVTETIGMCETSDNSPSPVIFLGEVMDKY